MPPISGSSAMLFESTEDVWDIISVLIQEVKKHNNNGKNFDIAKSINIQIPFFACKNIFHSNEFQKDIQRYIYCQDFNTSPYDGSYGSQPVKWIEKAFIIKNALAKLNKDKIEDGKSR